MSETSLTGPPLAKIKSAIDEEKHTSEIIIKFFDGSSLQDITTNFNNINRYIEIKNQLGIRTLLISFFVNKEESRIMTTGEIEADYLNIYRDDLNLKAEFKKVKILHHQASIKNIVYTVYHGTMDWIRETNITLFISITARGTNWFSGIYRLTWINKLQFNMIADGKNYSGNTATFNFDGQEQSFNVVAVNSSTVRSKITWCLEFVAEAGIPTEFKPIYSPDPRPGPLTMANN